MNLTAKRDDLLMPLKNYEVSFENVQHKIPEEQIIVKIKISSAKKLK